MCCQLVLTELHLADVRALVAPPFLHIYLMENYTLVTFNNRSDCLFQTCLFLGGFSKTAVDVIIDDYDSSCFYGPIPSFEDDLSPVCLTSLSRRIYNVTQQCYRRRYFLYIVKWWSRRRVSVFSIQSHCIRYTVNITKSST